MFRSIFYSAFLLCVCGCIGIQNPLESIPQKGDGVVRVYPRAFDVVWKHSLDLSLQLGLKILSEDKEAGGILLSNKSGSERVFVLLDDVKRNSHTEVEVIWKLDPADQDDQTDISNIEKRAYWKRKTLETQFQDKLETSLMR